MNIIYIYLSIYYYYSSMYKDIDYILIISSTYISNDIDYYY